MCLQLLSVMELYWVPYIRSMRAFNQYSFYFSTTKCLKHEAHIKHVYFIHVELFFALLWTSVLQIRDYLCQHYCSRSIRSNWRCIDWWTPANVLFQDQCSGVSSSGVKAETQERTTGSEKDRSERWFCQSRDPGMFAGERGTGDGVYKALIRAMPSRLISFFTALSWTERTYVWRRWAALVNPCWACGCIAAEKNGVTRRIVQFLPPNLTR